MSPAPGEHSFPSSQAAGHPASTALSCFASALLCDLGRLAWPLWTPASSSAANRVPKIGGRNQHFGTGIKFRLTAKDQT